MKGKKITILLSLALAAVMSFGACTPQNSQSNSGDSSSSSSSSSSSISEIVNEYVVTFVVDGQVVQTSTVQEGQFASFDGEEPTKAPTPDIYRYRFRGWDRSLDEPIMEDTTFNAVFAEYVEEAIIGDFENFSCSGDMIDDGWTAIGYSGTSHQWTEGTNATVSLANNSVEGQKALRFDAWENDMDYKIAKYINENDFPKSCNALRFRLMVPSINTVKVLLHGKVVIGGQIQSPYFTYTLNVTSNEYVEYTIPLSDPGWALWNEPGKSIHSVAEWTGIHEDDLLNYLTRFEIYIRGNDGKNYWPYVAYLDSAKFITIDNPSFEAEQNVELFERYTGRTASNEVIRFDFHEDGSALAKILTLQEPLEVPGNVVFNNENFVFTSSDEGQTLIYQAHLTNGGKKAIFIESSGTLEEETKDMELNAVQVVENFEQYTEDGKAYYQSNKDKNARTGCRGAYYSEYYNQYLTTTSDWGGYRWSLMGGNGDQLKLKVGPEAHTGNQYVCMKNSQSNGMRYMQWGLFDGTSERNAYRGSTMSFWAKTNGLVKKFYAYMYSQNHPLNETRDSKVKKILVEETEAIGEWKHYEIAIEPTLVYYGFMFYLEPNYSADSYLYVDDVEVYTDSPYAVYVTPPPAYELAPYNTYYGKYQGLTNVALRIEENNKVRLSSPALGIDEEGTYTGTKQDLILIFGDTKYTAVVSEDCHSFTFKEIEGTDDIANILNNMSFMMLDYLENAESYTEDGTMYCQNNPDTTNISGARGAYYCDMHNGGGDSSPVGGEGWALMGGSGDQLQLDSTNYYDGKQSLKIRKSAYADMRYMQWELFTGTAKGRTGVDKFTIYLKSQSGSASSIKIMVYKTQHVTNATQGEEYYVSSSYTLGARENWKAYTVNLNPNETYYGFAIMLISDEANNGWLNMDLAYYSGADLDPSISFYAQKDMSLNGVISGGDAHFTFDEGDKVYFTYGENQDVLGEYRMEMNDATQVMTIRVLNSVIKGNYVVNIDTGMVTFTVTEVTGDLATDIAIDTIFTNE